MLIPPTPIPTPLAADLLPTLLELSLAGVIRYTPVHDAAGQLVDFAFAYLNPAAQHLLRLPAHPAATYLQQFPPARTNGAFAFHRDTFLAGGAAHFELTDYPADGDSRYYRVAAQRVGGELLVSFTEPESQAQATRLVAEQQRSAGLEARVAERTQTTLRAQETAEMQRSRLERLLLALPAAICILGGPTLVHELVNPSYQALFSGRRLLGEPLLAAVPELADAATYQQLRQVYDTGVSHLDPHRHLVTHAADGTPQDRYFHSLFKPRRDEHGHIDGLLVFAFEITERVRGRQQVSVLNQQLLAANDALTTTNQQLTRANADLANFIYTASHDLKTPIANIESLVHALQRELAPAVLQADHVQAMLDMIQGAVERFQLTLSQLTDITRLQQGNGEPAEPVGLAALVEAVRLDLAPALAAAGAKLSVDVAACPHVSFAPKNLRSIVYNLLSNAIKYAAPGRAPEVTLRAYRAPGGAAVLEVQDNGLGLSAAQQAKLFGLFQRLHTHVEGSGIGLYMVRKIVENAGGTITVHSQPGSGSTFTVTLPD